MRFSKRFNPLVIGAAMLLAVTACSTAPSVDSNGDSNGDPKEISVWFPGNSPGEIELVNNVLVPAFEKETGSKVKVTFVDWADMSPKLNTSFAAGTAPDIFGHGPAAAAEFVKNDRVLALDDYIAELPQDDQDDLKSAFDAGIVNGKHYIVPLFVTANLLVYRSDILDDAGIDPADLGTWADVRDAAVQLTTPKRAGLLLGTAALQDQQSFAMLLSSNGGTLVTNDGKAPTFNDKAGVEALDFFMSLYQGDDAVGKNLGENYPSLPAAQRPLALGTAAIAIMSSSQLGSLTAGQPEIADLLGVLPPPGFAGHEGKTFGGGGTSLFINNDSTQLDLAWDFIKFVSSKEASAQYAEATGNLPSRASAADSDYISSNPRLRVFLDAVPYLVPNPNLPAWISVRDVMSKNLQLALAGKLSAQEALDQAAKEAAPLLSSD